MRKKRMSCLFQTGLKMNIRKCSILLLCFLLLLSGCTVNSAVKSTDLNLDEEDNEKSAPVPFEYFFRGFIALNYDQIEAYPKDSCIIESDDDWHDFMDKYVPGIPYDLTVDYSTECLVFSVIFPARPIYSTSADVETFVMDGDKFEAQYEQRDESESGEEIYAQNIDEIEHCFVNIVKIKKKYLPREAKNIYHLAKAN